MRYAPAGAEKGILVRQARDRRHLERGARTLRSTDLLQAENYNTVIEGEGVEFPLTVPRWPIEQLGLSLQRLRGHAGLRYECIAELSGTASALVDGQ